MIRLLTQDEVAERLRCTTSKVKRLRLDGKLPYIPGRPIMIDEADLERYIQAAKETATPPRKPKKMEKRKPDSMEEVALRARRAWIARHLRQKLK